MNKRYIFGVALALLMVSQSAVADQGDLTIGAKAGTLGAGAELTLGLSEDFAMRGGLNYLKFDFNVTLSEIDYTMEPDFKNLSVLLDYHPFSGTFRLTGGLYLTDNKVNLDGTVRRDLIPPQYGQYAHLSNLVHLNGSVDFNTVAPYAGLGWNSGHGESGWGVSCDLGVLFQGSATVSDLNVVTDVNYGEYQREVNEFLDEQKKEIQDELDKYEIYPVASIMLNYTF